jgi:iron-sulfur cluster repair protein YtfE (RIC family)
MSVMQPLRDEHAELAPHVEAIRRVADVVGLTSAPSLREQVAGVYEFLAHHLIPHAKAEDAVLYPEVERVLHSPGATAAMRRDHVEVAELTEQLRALEPELSAEVVSASVERSLRRILYGLYALVRLHFAEEEEIFVPVLEEGLSEERAGELFEAMQAAAADVRAGV